MSSKIYRLLRDNKEQGPFTSQELIQKGFKRYDLIWVDGRSAAWSYPGELPEFKLHVPDPEEQPFDRFFKKETDSVSPAVQAVVAINDTTIQAQTKQAKPRYKVSAAWSRIQTITVPLNREQMVTRSSDKPSLKITDTETAFRSKPMSWEDAWRDWEKEKSEVRSQHHDPFPAQQNNQVQPEPVAAVAQPIFPAQKQSINERFAESPLLETKYSEPLDSLKDKYIDNLLKQKKKSNIGFSLGRLSELVVPCIALFVIFSIGYWLLHNDNKTAAALGSSPTQTAQPAASKPVSELPSNLNTDATDNSTAAITTEKQPEVQEKTVMSQPTIVARTEQKKMVGTQKIKTNIASTNLAVNNDVTASQKVNTTKKLTDSKTLPTASNNNKTQENKSNTNSKLFDPKVINSVPRDNAYNDKASGAPGDLNAAEERPVRRRTNGDDITGKPSGTNNDAASDQPTVSKRSTGKANLKYVNVPQYVEMNNGTGSVKIENVSDVDLDLVVVDVQYYDASSRFRKGETLYLHNLKAGRSVVVKTPRDLNSQYATSKVSLVSADSKGVYIVGDN